MPGSWGQVQWGPLSSLIPINPARVAAAQVETLAGKVLAVEVDAGASLGDMRAGIEREVGVGVKQQRLIILGAGPKFCRIFLGTWLKFQSNPINSRV